MNPILDNTISSFSELMNGIFAIINEKARIHGLEKESKEVIDELIIKYNSTSPKLRAIPGYNQSVGKKVTERKKKAVTNKNHKWIIHPENENFSYCLDLMYKGKCFLKENEGNIIIKSIDDDGINDLTKEDAIFLTTAGYAYSF